MVNDVPRVSHDGVVGQVSSLTVPRFAAPQTFGLVPDSTDVPDARVGIIGVPFDSTVSYRPGARFGPTHIRNSSRLLRPYNPEAGTWPFLSQQVVDFGDVACNPFDIAAAMRSIEERTTDLLSHVDRILVLGGDHSISLPVLRALYRKHGPISVIHFDAHLDTWDTYFNQPILHGTVFRRAAEEGLLDPAGCAHVGIRGGLYGANDLDDDAILGFLPINCESIHLNGVDDAVKRVVARAKGRTVYISVDIDVLDPAFAPGTGTPEPGGLASWQLLYILRNLRDLNVVGGDIMEVAPAYDHAEITGIAAAHIGYELLSAWAPRIDPGTITTR